MKQLTSLMDIEFPYLEQQGGQGDRVKLLKYVA